MSNPIRKIIKLAISVSGVFAYTILLADPSSNVVWTKETRALLKNADIVAGEQSAQKCAKCHGSDGADPAVIEEEDTPYLHGQLAAATFKQIVDYQDKKRDDKIMFKRVRKLSLQEIANISVYYSQQAAPVASVDPSEVTPESVRMATRGDGTRFIPPCSGCHGLKGEGSIVDVPALAGQSPSYFETTMLAYKEEDRENDIYSRMRYIAAALTEKEIQELANYYASIGSQEQP